LNQGSTFNYTLSNTTQLSETFSATLRAGIADRLSQSAIFKQESISEVLPKDDSGKSYTSNSCIIHIFMHSFSLR